MAEETKPTVEFDAALLSQLACPACRGDLRAAEARLECGGCGRAYPVVDGIPVLIAERAEAGSRSSS